MLPDCGHFAHRLLVIQLGDIEDLMQTEPALRMLRQALPEADITLMTTPACSQVVSGVDDVLVCEDVTFLNAECEMTLIEKLRDRCFDAAIVLTNAQESPYPLAYICYLAGIPIRLGQSQEFGGGVLSQWVKSRELELQLVDKHLFLLKSAGFPLLHPNSSELNTVKELKQH